MNRFFATTCALPALVTMIAMAGAGCAGKHYLAGQITDRNGEPVEQAIISMKPGNVELITDREGRFMIDYLRDDSGERTKLAKRTDYTVEVFKAGYHIQEATVAYKRGVVEFGSITVTEDTVQLDKDDANIDPGQFVDRSHTAGAAYEGQ